jgi:hypothetical protein
MFQVRICHARGATTGDPLSPMLFLLVMEVLNALICKVDDWSLFQPLGVSSIPFRTSLYMDDLIMSLSLVSRDLQLA